MLLLLLLTFKILYSHNAYNFLLLRYFPVFTEPTASFQSPSLICGQMNVGQKLMFPPITH